MYFIDIMSFVSFIYIKIFVLCILYLNNEFCVLCILFR